MRRICSVFLTLCALAAGVRGSVDTIEVRRPFPDSLTLTSDAWTVDYVRMHDARLLGGTGKIIRGRLDSLWLRLQDAPETIVNIYDGDTAIYQRVRPRYVEAWARILDGPPRKKTPDTVVIGDYLVVDYHNGRVKPLREVRGRVCAYTGNVVHQEIDGQPVSEGWTDSDTTRWYVVRVDTGVVSCYNPNQPYSRFVYDTIWGERVKADPWVGPDVDCGGTRPAIKQKWVERPRGVNGTMLFPGIPYHGDSIPVFLTPADLATLRWFIENKAVIERLRDWHQFLPPDSTKDWGYEVGVGGTQMEHWYIRRPDSVCQHGRGK